ncbi:hypothetical protein B0H13DRAFT_1858568 [Mycena leptocephala]|nr:hypothetical protein B0H13DRAFT_1858568 [Mycena leptocephala]
MWGDTPSGAASSYDAVPGTRGQECVHTLLTIARRPFRLYIVNMVRLPSLPAHLPPVIPLHLTLPPLYPSSPSLFLPPLARRRRPTDLRAVPRCCPESISTTAGATCVALARRTQCHRDGLLEGLEVRGAAREAGCVGAARRVKGLDRSLSVRSLSTPSFLSSFISIGGSSSRIRASRHEARGRGRAGMRTFVRAGVACVRCLRAGARDVGGWGTSARDAPLPCSAALPTGPADIAGCLRDASLSFPFSCVPVYATVGTGSGMHMILLSCSSSGTGLCTGRGECEECAGRMYCGRAVVRGVDACMLEPRGVLI